jgi:hypothetical protein
MERAIAYLRVSTQRQRRSGLGIEAQRSSIARFAKAEDFTIIGEFVEAEPARARTPWTGDRNSLRLWLPPNSRNAAW